MHFFELLFVAYVRFLAYLAKFPYISWYPCFRWEILIGNHSLVWLRIIHIRLLTFEMHFSPTAALTLQNHSFHRFLLSAFSSLSGWGCLFFPPCSHPWIPRNAQGYFLFLSQNWTQKARDNYCCRWVGVYFSLWNNLMDLSVIQPFLYINTVVILSNSLFIIIHLWSQQV